MRARIFLQVRAPFYIALRNPGNNRATKARFFIGRKVAGFFTGQQKLGQHCKQGNNNV